MRQVEAARAGFARIGVARTGGGPGERVGVGKRVLFHDVLAGAQMPPEIGIVDLARKKPQQQNCAEGQQQSAKSAAQARARMAVERMVRDAAGIGVYQTSSYSPSRRDPLSCGRSVQ